MISLPDTVKYETAYILPTLTGFSLPNFRGNVGYRKFHTTMLIILH